MTIYHLRDLVNKERHRIPRDEAKLYQVPQYKGLSIENMLAWAK